MTKASPVSPSTLNHREQGALDPVSDVLMKDQEEENDEEDGDIFADHEGHEAPEGVEVEAQESGGIDDPFRCEECGPRRVLPDPGQPTQAEVEEHRIDHCPYRCWCPDCVAGRALGEQHRLRRGHRAVPVFSFDYLFITASRKVVRSLAHGEEALLKILVAVDSLGKAVFAHTVDVKGPGEDRYAVDRLVDDIRWLGYTRVSLRSDNEPAIVKLLHEALKSLRISSDDADTEFGVQGGMALPADEPAGETPAKVQDVVDDELSALVGQALEEHPGDEELFAAVGQVLEEHPARYDSAGNGEVENAIRRFSGLLRTLKLCLERRLGHRVPTDHRIMSWLVEHTAWILTVRVRGTDGMTAYHRIRGREYAKRQLGFAETVMFKLPSKGPTRKEDGSLDARWLHGVVLGYSRTSHEYWVFYDDRAMMVRSIQRVLLNVRWDVAKIEAVSVSRHDQHLPRGVERRLVPDSDLVDHPARRRAHLKGMPLRKSDFVTYGYTGGCQRCDHCERHGWGQTSMAHSKVCRERILSALRNTPDGRRRLQLHDQQARRWEEYKDGGAPPAEGEQPGVDQSVTPPFDFESFERERDHEAQRARDADPGWTDACQGDC